MTPRGRFLVFAFTLVAALAIVLLTCAFANNWYAMTFCE